MSRGEALGFRMSQAALRCVEEVCYIQVSEQEWRCWQVFEEEGLLCQRKRDDEDTEIADDHPGTVE